MTNIQSPPPLIPEYLSAVILLKPVLRKTCIVLVTNSLLTNSLIEYSSKIFCQEVEILPSNAPTLPPLAEA